MGIIGVKEIQPGMKLLQAIKNHQGQLLLPEGTLLSEKHIKLLKTWGVVEVSIEGVEPKKKDDLESLNEEERLAIEAEIVNKFPYYELDQINSELKRIASNYIARRYLAEHRK